MNNLKNMSFFFFLSLLLFQSIHAHTKYSYCSNNRFSDFFNPCRWRPLIALGAGGLFVHDVVDSKNFPARNGIFTFYNYPSSDFSSSRLFGTILIGAEINFSNAWLFQSGLSFFQSEPYIVNGIVRQGVDLQSSSTCSYQYDIQTQAVFLESKLLYQIGAFDPYVLVALGAAWNQSTHYKVTVIPTLTTFSPIFSNNTRTSFAYALGFGVDVPLSCDNARLGIGYRFTDMGAAKTGTTIIDNVATNYRLSQSHVYANEVIVQLTLILI